MPIKDKSRYPENWNEITQEHKERAGWKCERCGVEQGTGRIGIKKGRHYKVRLATAHLDHDPENPDARLVVLCEVCHLRHDRHLHGYNAKVTMRQRQHQRQLDAGQLRLFPDA